MASWFTTALDKITPWDRKGEVKRRQQAQTQPTTPKPVTTPNIKTNNSLDVISGAAKKPTTDFGTLSNKVTVPTNLGVISEPQKPGTVVKPTVRPKVEDTRAWGTKLFDTANPFDDGRSWAVPGKQSKPNFVQRNLSPTGVFNIGKEIVQGTARLPLEMGMTIVAPVKRIQAADKVREQAKANGTTPTKDDFKNAMDNAGSHSWKPSGWQKRVFGGDKVQNFFESGKDIKGAIKDATGKDVNSAITTAGIIGVNFLPGGRKANKAAIKSFEDASKASKYFAKNIPVKEAVDKGVKIPTRVVEGAPIQDVRQVLPGETPALAPKPKPTVRTPEPSPLIQDVSGGETFATPDALARRNVEDAMRAKADRFNSVDTGNMNDVTPRKASNTTKLTDAEVKASQDKIIDDYAAMLKNMGEGNGVAINPETGARITNNYRAPGTGSKRLTKAQWRDIAEQQLRGGSAEPSVQKGFDEAANPEVQSLLKQGEQAPQELGKLIRVKQVKGIDVQQVNDVPNMPETPGKVRVTATTDPLAAKTEAVAALPKVGSTLPDGRTVTKRMIDAAKRNNRNAKKLAKTRADTQAVIDGMQKPNSERLQTVEDYTNRGLTREQAEKKIADKQIVRELNDQFAGRKYNEGHNVDIIAHEDNRLDKTVPGITKIKQVTGYKDIGGVGRDGTGTYRKPQIITEEVDVTPPKNTSGYEIITSPDGSQTYVPKNNPSIAATGEFKTGKRGNVYEVRNRELGMQNARQSTQNTSIEQFLTDNADNNLWDDTKMFEANAILERTAGKVDPQLTKALASKIDAQASRQGGDLALLGRKVRTSGSSPDITNRFVSRFYAKTENATLTPEQIATVSKVNDEYTVARDTANQLYEQAMNSPTTENVDAYIKSKQVSDKLNKQAQFTELQIAKNATKGDKSEGAAKLIKQLTDETDVPDFDYVNANNLSGTGTIIRNNINNALVAGERVKANLSNVRGIPSGIKSGFNQWKNEIGMRMSAGGKNPINWVKNWSTSGNTAGDIWMKGVAKGDATKYYRESLIAQGYSGEELANRTRLLAEADPEQIAHQSFMEQLQQAGLASLTHGANGRKKLENSLIDSISGNFGNIPVVRNLAKGIVNTVLGYPTVTVRNAARGIDRLGLGVPNLIKGAGLKAIGKSNLAKVEFKQAARNAKSGAIIGGIGMALYNADMISFGYPTDKAEQQRWQDERKSEYSIKIGGAWYPISSTLGPFAIPLLAPGTVLDTIKNGGNVGDVAKDLGKMIVSSATPVDDMIAISKALNGEQSGNWWAQKAALLAGSQTPASGLLRQIAKIVDPVVRTTDKTASFAEQTLQNFKKGLPWFSKGNPAMTDSQGNEFTHPNAGQILLGASTKEAQAGVQHNNEMQAGANDTYSQLQQYGLLDNQNLMGLVDEKIQAQIARGQDLKPEQVKSIQKAVTKGISTSITADGDSNWRENGDYATDRIARQVKLQMLEADPTAKKSDIAALNTQIARDNVLEQNQVPYETLKLYQNTTVSEWRAMGNPESDAYDPETYKLLSGLDNLLTEVGGSYNTDPTKNKYTAKSSSGSGSGSKKMETSFGKLSSGSGSGGPSVRQYETANLGATSNIPIINIVRPNIVHKIGGDRVQ